MFQHQTIPKLADTKELDELLKGLNIKPSSIDPLPSAVNDPLSVPSLEDLTKEAKEGPKELLKSFEEHIEKEQADRLSLTDLVNKANKPDSKLRPADTP